MSYAHPDDLMCCLCCGRKLTHDGDACNCMEGLGMNGDNHLGKGLPHPYEIKDSGERKEFESGMVRDTAANKTEFDRVADGPMLRRWAEHLTKGCVKYPDVSPGLPNWTLAADIPEYIRFRKSAFRHFIQWFLGDTDEDHAAAVFFNINGAEYVKKRFSDRESEFQEVFDGNKSEEGPEADSTDSDQSSD